MYVIPNLQVVFIVYTNISEPSISQDLIHQLNPLQVQTAQQPHDSVRKPNSFLPLPPIHPHPPPTTHNPKQEEEIVAKGDKRTNLQCIRSGTSLDKLMKLRMA